MDKSEMGVLHTVLLRDEIIASLANVEQAEKLATYLGGRVVESAVNEKVADFVKVGLLPYIVALSLDGEYEAITKPTCLLDITRANTRTVAYVPEVKVGVVADGSRRYDVVGPAVKVWVWGLPKDVLTRAKRLAVNTLKAYSKVTATYRRVRVA